MNEQTKDSKSNVHQGAVGFRSSVAAKVVMYSGLCLAAVLGIAGFILMRETIRIVDTQSQQDVQNDADLVANTVSLFGQIGDMDSLKHYLADVRKKPEFQDVYVVRAAATEKEHKPRAGAASRDAIDRQVADTAKSYEYRDGAKHTIRYVVPSLANASCLQCHAMAKVGDVLGVTSITISTLANDRMERNLMILLVVAGTVSFISTLVMIVLVVVRCISRPIGKCVAFTHLLATGDFSKDVSDLLRERSDEMGDLARAVQTMTVNTRKLLKSMSDGVQTLATAASELSAVSAQTSQSVQAMSAKTSTVATAADESSANTTSVAEGMGQASANLTSVASATEEMSATIGEIAANSEKARAISADAGAQASSVSTLMQQLGQAAQEIGKVTETIAGISSQTNLLALNATIEAARAGAAGKGFAVVANEIKELARQTAAATEDIKAKIGGVQTSAGSAIADIEKITVVINEVGQIVASIATAIEEQSTVTRDVAGNIAQASAGVRDANERVAQTASMSKTMAQDIASVNTAAGEIREGGEQVQASAMELSKLAEQLKAIVGQFRVDSAERVSVDESAVAVPAGNADVLIPWTASLSVGVMAMDAHHQKLINMINELHAALRQKRGLDVGLKLLVDLDKYVRYHFHAEEELMRKANYPKFEDQLKAHKFFLDKVATMRQRWEAGDKSVPMELMRVLQDWLVAHIMKMDKQYQAYLK